MAINKKQINQNELSQQEYIQIITNEIKKCAQDYVYFLNNYGYIDNPNKGLVPFDMRDYQEDAIKLFNSGKDTIILKSRQLGLSTTIAAFVACNMVFKDSYKALVLCTKTSDAKDLVKKVKTFIHNFPEWLLQEEITTNNKKSIELENDSWCKATSSSDNAGRHESLSLLWIDEAAFIDNIDTIWTGASETLSETGGQAIAVSTPCVTGDTEIKLRNKKTGKIKNIPIEEFYNMIE